MMINHMGFYGVTTNNLKNVCLNIPKGTIVGLTGISGGGKSSLAFGTVYAVCNAEFNSIWGDPDEGQAYRLERFENIVPAISIRQKENNSNPHSTLFSYFKIQNLLLRDLGAVEDVSLLRLNSYENLCESCRGARLKYEIDETKVVDSRRTVDQFPFRLFSGANRDKEAAKLVKYCESIGVPLDCRLADLSSESYARLVYGRSETKIGFRFKYSGSYRSRNEFYEGPMPHLKSCLASDKKSDKQLAIAHSSSVTCRECCGSGVNRRRYESASLAGVSFFDLLTLEVDQLAARIRNDRLRRFFDYMSRLGLGHLTLSRSIPSLSGGELQKMRLAKAASTPITGLLYVLDEVSSNLYPKDYPTVACIIEEICKKGNSVLLVDHVSEILKISDSIYSLGPAAGLHGGHLKPMDSSALPQHNQNKMIPYALQGEILESPYVRKNNINGLSLSFEKGSFCCVMGPSGSGKSTFFRQWAEMSDDVLYVTQDLPRSNCRSTVATYLDLSDKAAKSFAAAVGKPESLFKYTGSNPNLCKRCNGVGEVAIGDAYFGQLRVECPECGGNRIIGIESIILRGLNFNQMLSLPAEDLRGIPELDRLHSSVDMLDKLGLGYISLGRRTESLSGGEIKRLKLARHLQKKIHDRILVIDEPCAGLDSGSCKKILSYLSTLSRNLKVLIVIEHRQEVLEHVDYVHLFGPGAGRMGGRLIGTKRYTND